MFEYTKLMSDLIIASYSFHVFHVIKLTHMPLHATLTMCRY